MFGRRMITRIPSDERTKRSIITSVPTVVVQSETWGRGKGNRDPEPVNRGGKGQSRDREVE